MTADEKHNAMPKVKSNSHLHQIKDVGERERYHKIPSRDYLFSDSKDDAWSKAAREALHAHGESPRDAIRIPAG